MGISRELIIQDLRSDIQNCQNIRSKAYSDIRFAMDYCEEHDIEDHGDCAHAVDNYLQNMECTLVDNAAKDLSMSWDAVNEILC